MIKYDTGDIQPFKFFTKSNKKGGDYHYLLAEGHWIIEQLFLKDRDITETKVTASILAYTFERYLLTGNPISLRSITSRAIRHIWDMTIATATVISGGAPAFIRR